MMQRAKLAAAVSVAMCGQATVTGHTFGARTNQKPTESPATKSAEIMVEAKAANSPAYHDEPGAGSMEFRFGDTRPWLKSAQGGSTGRGNGEDDMGKLQVPAGMLKPRGPGLARIAT